MDFQQAVAHLRQNKKARRKCWNPTAFIVMAWFPLNGRWLIYYIEEGVQIRRFYDTQDDINATDWELIKEIKLITTQEPTTLF